MGKILTIIVILIVIAAGAWAIFGHSSSNTSSSSNSGVNSQNGNTKPEDTNAVSIADFAFSPSNIRVKKGSDVTWTNNDSIAHTVTESDDKNGPDSGTLEPGKSYSFTYAQVGTFNYKCTLHPEMTGTVTVVASNL